ncbi:hypothetical protein E0E04_03705 [Streptococcus vicugnae]|uniref:DUF6287 domain-containing protein n=1 Tax=Streptococcus vicugnae TaxID=2740579 RepID=A0A4V2ZCL6_9STRE|nr:DUF6287 domain-containing protein [Streptococcus vicugnae]TDE73853.1 hypothetical protein E0E04_03705 [Streptococcus vicugnae]
MKKNNHYFWISGLLVLTACGIALAVNNHSHHKQAKAQTNHHLTHKTSANKKASKSAKKKQVDKRLDLFQLPNEKKITDDLVKDGKNIVNSRQVSKQASQFDFAALAQGDFSSLAGTWQDANGYTFEFSPQGLVSKDGRLTLSALTYDDKGEAISQVTSLTGGFILYYYAAGNQIPNWHFNITDTDPSDYGRDRLFAAQLSRFDYESTQQFVNSVFYKISDNYSKVTQDDKKEAEQEEDTENTPEQETETRAEQASESQENAQNDVTIESQTETAATN